MWRTQILPHHFHLTKHNTLLAYADDVNLIGDDIRTIERNACVLLNACKDIGLEINIWKTKYVKFSSNES